MGFNNPPISWQELEKRLSGPERAQRRQRADVPYDPGPVSRVRHRYTGTTEDVGPAGPVVPYAELHCHTHYSFLDGASAPDALVEQAVRLGLSGLALTDHDGFAGAPLFAETAQFHASKGKPLTTTYGAELSLSLSGPQNGVADPSGSHLLVLAIGVEGYHRLSAAMTEANLRGDEKGRPDHDLAELVDQGRGHWMVLTGCRKGWVRQALDSGGGRAAGEELDRLVALFGHDAVNVELIDHGLPTDQERNQILAGLAQERGLPVVATNNVHYARPENHRLADAMAAVRARRGLAEMDGWLPPWGGACLRSGAEMLTRFARHPGAVERSVELSRITGFDLQSATPKLPKHGIPDGRSAQGWLEHLTWRGFEQRYADRRHAVKARKRIAHELKVIGDKDFAGYFVIVHDIVAFARGEAILCQGRGSAASSAVCYALGITAIDPVFYGLPFERFLSVHRDDEPDIDVDFDSDRREEVIQWVYERYGRRNAAQVANVITYRPRMAVRDAAKALGFSSGQQDAWSKQIDGWSASLVDATSGSTGEDESGVPSQVRALAQEFLTAPRHLGIHSGGMILTERPIGEVVPIERARMEKRTVVQWDKDGCAYMGLVKFDLLGLGMLGAINHMMELTGEHLGEHWTLQTLPQEEPAVYDMLCRADSIGVFQVESRAQIGTLPRLRPRKFYDLAIEIALIRPGPIQGGAVHPYIRRATGEDPVTYVHPDLEPVLARTLGIPLFQEQLMQMAIAVGDCTADEADLLRRAMGSKRGLERIESIRDTLFEGMARRGLVGEVADTIYQQILSFASFGFAESHSLSFALLVYVSSWFKLHYPAAFLAGLLRAQPMGFYSPQSLVADARRHGVEVLRPDIMASGSQAGLECRGESDPSGFDSCLQREWQPTPYDPHAPDPTLTHRRDAGFACRLGLDQVRGIGLEVAQRIVAAREEAPFTDLTDLSRRAGLTSTQLESLATAGACEGLGLDRRQALWQAGFSETQDQLLGSAPVAPPPMLPGMDGVETTHADLWATGITTELHPLEHVRELLQGYGIRAVKRLDDVETGRRIHVAGLVTHRQRPGTAGGVTFLSLEDETGMLNVVVSAGVWQKHRRIARNVAGLVVRGIIERQDGATNLVADRLSPLAEVDPMIAEVIRGRHPSRDFQ